MLDAFFAVEWRQGPALVLILLGTLLALRGLRTMPGYTQPKVDLMTWLVGFRRAVIGLAIALTGLAWLLQLPWLLAIAVLVGLQETRESSHYITTLEGAERTGRPSTGGPPLRRPAPGAR